MMLSVIIVNWNGGHLIIECLNSIFKSKTSFAYEVIVVDNNSQDHSPQEISKRFPKVILLQQKRNLGFGKGNNLGVRRASGKFILFLNPDTIINNDTLEGLVGFISKHPEAGIVGCKVLYPNGSLQKSAYRKFPGISNHILEYNYLLRGLILAKHPNWDKSVFPTKDYSKTLEATHLMGSCLLVRRQEFQTIGGFDENFFLYREETDLCARYLRDGYKIVYTPSVSIKHHMGGVSRNKFTPASNYYMESTYKFFNKYKGKFYTFTAWISALLSLIFNSFTLLSLKSFLRRKYLAVNGDFWLGTNNHMLSWHLKNFLRVIK
jgi:GT2 family glycosyltransferase